jgi:uncharacterized protein YdeI (YjbR/CyaY-like superfamily)
VAAVKVDPAKVRTFKDADAFYKWLGKNHDKADEVWIKLHKAASGLKSITAKEAIDVVLCWGWIDGVRKSFDETSFLQRYSPRTKKSIWSKINVDNVARLIRERAYKSGKDMTIPADLQAAIDAEPKALATFKTLSAQNRFALAFRLHNMKTEAGRKNKVATFVAMLKRGETIYPQRKK